MVVARYLICLARWGETRTASIARTEIRRGEHAQPQDYYEDGNENDEEEAVVHPLSFLSLNSIPSK